MSSQAHVASPARTASIYRQRLPRSPTVSSPSTSAHNSPNSGKGIRIRRNSLSKDVAVRNAKRRGSLSTVRVPGARRNSFIRGIPHLKIEENQDHNYGASPIPATGVKLLAELSAEEDAENEEIRETQDKWRKFLPGFYEQTLVALGNERKKAENDLILAISTKIRKRLNFVQHDVIRFAGKSVFTHSKGPDEKKSRPRKTTKTTIRRSDTALLEVSDAIDRHVNTADSDAIPLSSAASSELAEKLETYVKSTLSVIRDEIHKSTASEKSILENLLKKSVGELDQQHNLLVKLYEKKLDSMRVAAEMTVRATQIRLEEDWRNRFDALRESLKHEFSDEKSALLKQFESLRKVHNKEKVSLQLSFEDRLRAELDAMSNKKEIEKQPLLLRIQELEREKATLERKLVATRLEAQEQINQSEKTVQRLEHEMGKLRHEMVSEQERAGFEARRLKQEVEKLKVERPAGWDRMSETEKKEFLWRLRKEKLRGVFQESQHKKVVEDLQDKYRMLQRKFIALLHERRAGSAAAWTENDPALQGLLSGPSASLSSVEGDEESDNRSAQRRKLEQVDAITDAHSSSLERLRLTRGVSPDFGAGGSAEASKHGGGNEEEASALPTINAVRHSLDSFADESEREAARSVSLTLGSMDVPDEEQTSRPLTERSHTSPTRERRERPQQKSIARAESKKKALNNLMTSNGRQGLVRGNTVGKSKKMFASDLSILPENGIGALTAQGFGGSFNVNNRGPQQRRGQSSGGNRPLSVGKTL